MKKFFLLGLALSAFTMNAQEKVKEVVSADYNRNSVSYVFVNRTQPHASDVNNFYATLEVDGKFDRNNIKTTKLNVAHNTGEAAVLEDVTAAVNSANLGKEIVSFIYNRKANGTFDDALILERGLYDAKDQDIKNAGAAKVKEMSFVWGEPLINSSYVVVVDIYNTNVARTDNATNYSVKANAHAYKLNAGREVLDNFYANAWADVTTPEADRKKAMAAYDAMAFDLTHVATVSVSGSSSTTKFSEGSIYASCQSAYEEIVYQLEKNIPAWQVATTFISAHPLAAKIGTKEGVKNGSRFQTYSYKENNKGELVSVKHGMVRATVVANNEGVATGETQPSLFYQISGVANVQEGYTLKQKNDYKIGASLSLGVSPVGFRTGLDMDYIANIGKNGSITYGMVNLGINFYELPIYDVMVGAGYGIPFTRFFELTPYIMGGAYLVNWYDQFETLGYLAEPGVRFAVTLQPLSIYLAAGYQVAISDGLPSSATVKFGVKWTF